MSSSHSLNKKLTNKATGRKTAHPIIREGTQYEEETSQPIHFGRCGHGIGC